jgi:hypothetical protein
MSALRHNKGKIRYNLAPPFAQEQYVRALEFGSGKYGDSNWKKGMDWKHVIDSMYRHLEAIRKGEDYDAESGLLHSAHIMCNAAFLTEYYKIYPQGDTRDRKPDFKFGLTLNLFTDVCMSLSGDSGLGFKNTPTNTFACLSFWESLKPKPIKLNFIPHCIFATGIPKSNEAEYLLRRWLMNNYNFDPTFIRFTYDDLSDLDFIVEIDYKAFCKLRTKIFCYLVTTTANQAYDVGHRRLFDLSEI